MFQYEAEEYLVSYRRNVGFLKMSINPNLLMSFLRGENSFSLE